MEAIKETVQSVIHNLQAKKTKGMGSDPEVVLQKILTKRELSHIKCKYFKRGILGISVDSSSWLYSLSLKKEDLLRRLQQGSNKIKDIRFFIGEM